MRLPRLVASCFGLSAPLLGLLPAMGLEAPTAVAQSGRSGQRSAPSPATPGLAGSLETVWGDGRLFHRLQVVQDQEAPLKRASYALLIRPEDQAESLVSLSLRIPDSFDGSLILSSLRLCRMLTPPTVPRTGCSEELPIRLEPLSPRELRIIPRSPLAGDGIHGLKLAMFNPSVAGAYPFRLYQGAGGESVHPRYLGTWVLWIQPDGD